MGKYFLRFSTSRMVLLSEPASFILKSHPVAYLVGISINRNSGIMGCGQLRFSEMPKFSTAKKPENIRSSENPVFHRSTIPLFLRKYYIKNIAFVSAVE
jgi:hypothetical protein